MNNYSKLFRISKFVTRFLPIFFNLSGAKECRFCRSRKMLQNEPTLAIVAVDTEENERLRFWVIHSVYSFHSLDRGCYGGWRIRLHNGRYCLRSRFGSISQHNRAGSSNDRPQVSKGKGGRCAAARCKHNQGLRNVPQHCVPPTATRPCQRGGLPARNCLRLARDC